jgi:hypothetical protein
MLKQFTITLKNQEKLNFIDLDTKNLVKKLELLNIKLSDILYIKTTLLDKYLRK